MLIKLIVSLCSSSSTEHVHASIKRVHFLFLGLLHHWGGGWNREMKRLMLGHAFQWVETVRFRVGEGNARSRRALAKIGARETGESEVVTTASGAARHLVYAIRRAEFEAGPLAG